MKRFKPGRLTLRATLVSLLVGLLLLTVLSLGTVAHFSSTRVVQELEDRSFRLAALAISAQVGSYLEPALPLLEEARAGVHRGRLPIDDEDLLGELLAERLRHEKTVGWFSYSAQATGRFTGAWRRDDGAIILNQSSPDVDDGRPRETELTVGGLQIPFRRELPGGYDPRQRDWYRQAIASEGVVWTEPFQFNEGVMGITAALPVRPPGVAEPLGVFTADFFLPDVSRFLVELAEGTSTPRTQVFVFTRSGKLVAGSRILPAEDIAKLLGAVRGGMEGLEVGAPAPVKIDLAGVRYTGALQAFPVARGVEWVAGVIVPEDQVLQVVYDGRRDAVGLGLIFVLLAVALGWLVAHRISQPLNAISRDLRRVGEFNLSNERPPTSFVEEIAVVSNSVERMKASLRSFGHYVPTEQVRLLIGSGQEARLGGEHRRLTMFFSDIEGFTRHGEQLAPGRLVEHLGTHLQVMTSVIEEQQGTVDKFLGDGVLAFFNAPREVPDHAARGCCAALQSQERLKLLANVWAASNTPLFRVRIGLHLGEVFVGNIGTPERFEYTAIGDAVNLASRLEALNKIYGTAIVASQEVRDEAGLQFEWRTLDNVAVVGREGGTLVSELLGERGMVRPEIIEVRDLYEQALEAYFARKFDCAAERFRAAGRVRGGDQAAALMAARADAFKVAPPADEWSGVHAMTAK